MHFNFVLGSREDGGATMRAEKAPAVVAHLPLDRHCILREHCSGIEQRAVMLATVQTMAEASPIGLAYRRDSDAAT